MLVMCSGRDGGAPDRVGDGGHTYHMKTTGRTQVSAALGEGDFGVLAIYRAP